MRRWIELAIAALFGIASMTGLCEAADRDCHVAVYRLDNGKVIDVAPEGAADLRWRLMDGRTGKLVATPEGGWVSHYGWTNDIDHIPVSFGPCGAGEIRFQGHRGKAMTFDVQETRFTSQGVSLAGRLVLPKAKGPVPLMVLAHGSERSSALINGFRQRLYPSQGVGVFVFDKRGTGKSAGKYTQDFDVLAGDVAAAVIEARRLAGSRAARVGLQGGSQAGWILPIAAARTPVDFVIIGYGVAATPLVEDRTETMQDLQAAGWGADVLKKAREVTDATDQIVASHFRDGYPALSAVVAKYGSEPWFRDLKGEFTGEIVKHSEAELRIGGPARDEGTTWNVDAVGNLRRTPAPLLWMVAGDDTEGAGPETIENLMSLRAEGRPITVAVFPRTEHGIHYYRLGKHGERQETGYAPDYFKMELDFARKGQVGLLHPSADVLRRLNPR